MLWAVTLLLFFTHVHGRGESSLSESAQVLLDDDTRKSFSNF